ncbi:MULTISPECIES: GNAT family N-acetyltransferase [Bacteroidales]|jgi:GNAT superfamily N-acetyltransferase|uniref:GNAT family N-acetyltransferase n=1 Tax=Lepagella muris TaxID=3032870 RepID=A0AC61RF67_9BACT|nr:MULTISPECIES: GNAT family N-acetyltransferase [Bacteroidales]ROT05810.1 GNAT family N-acetyltransferase [Muribaculaceae bacterium Isolate-037 (Harlan)]TGY79204.1 GNAT family N-acetyltransferase [Lepagella muris]THG51523.1 GNAT family N-acetyltransferase [Bacteroidales bacterium]TKC59370.1 GNAT family N-acetyltransferase [Bacteroidales bacterium]
MIRIEKLTDNHNLTSFDCGDVDLNEFLTDDAIPFQEKRIATTYIVIINDRVAAYFSLLNDKVSRTDVSKSAWRKLKKLFAHSKHRSNYPAIKIGRFAVCKDFASQGLGSVIMDAIKQSVNEKSQYSAFRFLTVDAYISAIPFYLKNGFIEMLSEQENDTTRTMYFDMLNL